MHKGQAALADCCGSLATDEDTVLVKAILEAGRRSLDSGRMPHPIEYAPNGSVVALLVV